MNCITHDTKLPAQKNLQAKIHIWVSFAIKLCSEKNNKLRFNIRIATSQKQKSFTLLLFSVQFLFIKCLQNYKNLMSGFSLTCGELWPQHCTCYLHQFTCKMISNQLKISIIFQTLVCFSDVKYWINNNNIKDELLKLLILINV